MDFFFFFFFLSCFEIMIVISFVVENFEREERKDKEKSVGKENSVL